ncbi:unnamed protein product, partial [Dicrocoelium dendriticum]
MPLRNPSRPRRLLHQRPQILSSLRDQSTGPILAKSVLHRNENFLLLQILNQSLSYSGL